jgi:hypothetical protein
LLLGHAERSSLRLWFDARSHAREQLGGAVASRAPVDATPQAALLDADREVLRDGQLGEECRLLIDRGNT